MHIIYLYRTPQGWMARHTDPAVTALFGTDVLPTAFTAAAEVQLVVAEIERLNPDVKIVLAEGSVRP